MAKDLTVFLDNRPGTLAALGRAAGQAGINIDGLAGMLSGDEAIIHILVEDAAQARTVLDGAGIKVGEEREVLVMDAEDRPGAVGEIAGRIAATGANIDLVYLATRTRLVIGADDLEAARAAV